jgi:tetratricopeptide (TPR) repeat protein
MVAGWRSGYWQEMRLRGMPDRELAALAAARPTDARAQRHQGERLLARGELPEAEKRFRLAVEADPTDARAWTAWGNVTLALGQPRPALEILKRTVEEWPDRADARFGLAAAYTELGDTDSAVPHWQAGLARAPGRAQAWLALAAGLEQRGEVGPAREAYARTLERGPGNLRAKLGLARCSIKLHRVSEAQTIVGEVLKDDPSHLEARMLLAEGLIARGDGPSRDAGMKELARAAAFHPESPGPHRRLGELWMEDGELPDAAQAFAQAADREPSNETHLERCAEAYRRLKLPGSAKSLERRVAEVKLWKREVERLERVARASPGDPRPLLKRARVCERLAWREQEADAYRRVLALQPSNAEASRKLPAIERLLRTQHEERQVLFSAQ